MAITNSTIEVQGIEIAVQTNFEKQDYISLTDIAKYRNVDDPSGVIRNWMSNKNSFAFYSLWEELNNENFNSVGKDRIKINEVGYNSFTMTPGRWKKEVNAIGIIPSAGKYSKGTFAHPDIAFEFASWLSPEFRLYIIKEFQRLKKDENHRLKLEWNVKREIAKFNYKIHTNAIKQHLISERKKPSYLDKYHDEIKNKFELTGTKISAICQFFLAKNSNIGGYQNFNHYVKKHKFEILKAKDIVHPRYETEFTEQLI